MKFNLFGKLFPKFRFAMSQSQYFFTVPFRQKAASFPLISLAQMV